MSVGVKAASSSSSEQATVLAPLRSLLPRSHRLTLDALAVTVVGQATLGIVTLLSFVPVSLGAAHQAGSLTLFTVSLLLLRLLRTAVRRLPLP